MSIKNKTVALRDISDMSTLWNSLFARLIIFNCFDLSQHDGFTDVIFRDRNTQCVLKRNCALLSWIYLVRVIYGHFNKCLHWLECIINMPWPSWGSPSAVITCLLQIIILYHPATTSSGKLCRFFFSRLVSRSAVTTNLTVVC